MNYEDWDDGNSFSIKRLLLIMLIIGLLVGVPIAIAAYKIFSPPGQPVTVSDVPELTAPTFNATSLFTGETLQITVSITPATDGVQIFFYQNDSNIGSAYTNSNGDAILNKVMTSPGTYIFDADAVVSP